MWFLQFCFTNLDILLLLDKINKSEALLIHKFATMSKVTEKGIYQNNSFYIFQILLRKTIVLSCYIEMFYATQKYCIINKGSLLGTIHEWVYNLLTNMVFQFILMTYFSPLTFESKNVALLSVINLKIWEEQL